MDEAGLWFHRVNAYHKRLTTHEVGERGDERRLHPVGVDEVRIVEISMDRGGHRGEEAGQLPFRPLDLPEIVGNSVAVGQALIGGVERVLESFDLDAVDSYKLGCTGVVRGEDFDLDIVVLDERAGEIGDKSGDGVALMERVGRRDE